MIDNFVLLHRGGEVIYSNHYNGEEISPNSMIHLASAFGILSNSLVKDSSSQHAQDVLPLSFNAKQRIAMETNAKATPLCVTTPTQILGSISSGNVIIIMQSSALNTNTYFMNNVLLTVVDLLILTLGPLTKVDSNKSMVLSVVDIINTYIHNVSSSLPALLHTANCYHLDRLTRIQVGRVLETVNGIEGVVGSGIFHQNKLVYSTIHTHMHYYISLLLQARPLYDTHNDTNNNTTSDVPTQPTTSKSIPKMRVFRVYITNSWYNLICICINQHILVLQTATNLPFLDILPFMADLEDIIAEANVVLPTDTVPVYLGNMSGGGVH